MIEIIMSIIDLLLLPFIIISMISFAGLCLFIFDIFVMQGVRRKIYLRSKYYKDNEESVSFKESITPLGLERSMSLERQFWKDRQSLQINLYIIPLFLILAGFAIIFLLFS